MSQLGSKKKPARIRVQTEERGMELFALCELKGWQVIVGIELDNNENIDDILKLQSGVKVSTSFQSSPSRNAACPCGSGKQYKRCCGK